MDIEYQVLAHRYTYDKDVWYRTDIVYKSPEIKFAEKFIAEWIKDNEGEAHRVFEIRKIYF